MIRFKMKQRTYSLFQPRRLVAFHQDNLKSCSISKKHQSLKNISNVNAKIFENLASYFLRRMITGNIKCFRKCLNVVFIFVLLSA